MNDPPERRRWLPPYEDLDREPWYPDVMALAVYLHLLVRAARAPCSQNGIFLEPGDVLTSRRQLAKELNAGEWQVRNALAKLIASGKIFRIPVIVSASRMAGPTSRRPPPNVNVFRINNFSVPEAVAPDPDEGVLKEPQEEPAEAQGNVPPEKPPGKKVRLPNPEIYKGLKPKRPYEHKFPMALWDVEDQYMALKEIEQEREREALRNGKK